MSTNTLSLISNSYVLPIKRENIKNFTKKFKLTKSQKKCYRTIRSIQQNYPIVINTSPAGAGKTYTSLYNCNEDFDYVAVICKRRAVKTWTDLYFKSTERKDRFDSNGLCKLLIINSEKLIIKNNFFLNVKKNDFEISEEFYELLSTKRVHVIIDESHNIKNTNTKIYKACKKIISCIVHLDNSSKVSLLSATPYDTEELAKVYIGFFGYSTSVNHKNFSNSDLFKFCEQLNSKKLDEILDTLPEDSSIDTLLSLIYQRIFCVFSVKIEGNKFGKFENYLYNLIHKYQNNKITCLLNEIKKIKESGTKKKGGERLTEIQKFLQEIEYEKMTPLSSIIKDKIKNEPNTKIIIYLNYIKSIDAIEKHLKSFNYNIIKGEIKISDRHDIIDKFNEPNLDCQILICSSECVSENVSFHDTNGGFPRASYISPSYHAIRINQILRRAYRNGIKSNSENFIYYTKDDSNEICESSVMNSLNKKNETIEKCSGNTFANYQGEIEI